MSAPATTTEAPAPQRSDVICLVNAIHKGGEEKQVGSAIFYYHDLEWENFGPKNPSKPSKRKWITTPDWVARKDSPEARWITAPELPELGSGFFKWEGKVLKFTTEPTPWWEEKPTSEADAKPTPGLEEKSTSEADAKPPPGLEEKSISEADAKPPPGLEEKPISEADAKPPPGLEEKPTSKADAKPTPRPNIHIGIFPKSKDYETGSVIPAGWAVHTQGDPMTLSSIGAMFPIYRGFYPDPTFNNDRLPPVIYQETVKYQTEKIKIEDQNKEIKIEDQNKEIKIEYRCIYYYVAKILGPYEPIKGLTEKETGKAEEAVAGVIIISPAEQARRDAEGQRIENERARGEAEEKRLKGESDRGKAEAERLNAESDRGKDEEKRLKAENDRGKAEAERLKDEKGRGNAEEQRTVAEAERTEAEAGRMTAELGRVEAEIERLDIEYKRLKPMADDLKAKADQLAGQVKGLTDKLAPMRVRSKALKTEEDNLTEKAKALRDLLEAHEKDKKKDGADAETQQKGSEPAADNAAKFADGATPPAT